MAFYTYIPVNLYNFLKKHHNRCTLLYALQRHITDLARLVVWLYRDPELEAGTHLLDQVLTLPTLLSGSIETPSWSLWCPPVGPATDLARLVVWLYGDPELEAVVPTRWTSY